jgi:hypothetical protein
MAVPKRSVRKKTWSEVKIIAVDRKWWKHFTDALYFCRSNRN